MHKYADANENHSHPGKVHKYANANENHSHPGQGGLIDWSDQSINPPTLDANDSHLHLHTYALFLDENDSHLHLHIYALIIHWSEQ